MKEYENYLKKLEEKGLYIDNNGIIQRKDPLIKLWVANNFMVAFNFGKYALGHTKEEYMPTRKIFKSCEEFEKLSGDERTLFIFAFASLLDNLKIHLARLKNNKKVIKGQQFMEIVMDEKIDPLLELAVQTGLPYDFTKDPIIEEKITIFSGPVSKKEPKAPKGFEDVAKLLQEKFNKLNGKKHGIPDFACNVAFQVDFWLKKFMPGITTPKIIRDLFTYAGLTGYDDISQIDNYIKRGKKAASK